MADDEDVRALHNGIIDMANRDLRDGDFSGLNLQDRNFKGALLENANFTRASLKNSQISGAKLIKMQAANADMSNIDATSTVFLKVNLRGANLRNGQFAGSHFNKTDLTGADLRGANFKKSYFKEGTIFDDCLVDSTTIFDGVDIFRPLARQEAFKYYTVVSGKLFRKPEDNSAASSARITNTLLEQTTNLHSIAQQQVIQQIDILQQALKNLRNTKPSTPQHGKIGHNNPPEDIPLEEDVLNELAEVLQTVRKQVVSDVPDLNAIERAKKWLSEVINSKICIWLAKKADVAAEGFAEEAGKSLANWKAWIGGWFIFTGEIDRLLDLLSNLG